MNYDEIKQLYQNKQYMDIINIVENNNELKKIDFCEMFLGFSYLELQEPRKAINCLKNVKYTTDKENYGKTLRYMGLAEYILGNYADAINDFNLSAFHKDDEAILWKKLLFPNNVKIHETENIVFRFNDHIDEIKIKIFIMRSLKAYTHISNFINRNVLSKKIDIYVYTERFDSLGNPLSYADNGTKSIHICYNDFIGHEIAHILFNSLYPRMQRNEMIDEGIATFFDQQLLLSDYLKKYHERMVKFDILSCWEKSNLDNRMKSDLYYFAGAFVGYLLERYGRESFLIFIENEDIYNAKKIFGESPQKIVREFYDMMK